MHDDVNRLDGRRKRLLLRQIRLDRNSIRSAAEICGERLAVVHEPQIAIPGREVPRKEAAEISRGTGDEDAGAGRHGYPKGKAFSRCRGSE